MYKLRYTNKYNMYCTKDDVICYSKKLEYKTSHRAPNQLGVTHCFWEILVTSYCVFADSMVQMTAPTEFCFLDKMLS